jgi:hypothetical protein
VICRDGREHVMSQCLDCGANALGRWVARDRVPEDVADLPVAKDHRKPPRRREPGLFDEM